MIWKISKSSHFKLLIKCFQAIVIKLQREKFFKVALLSYKKMALLALFKTNHTSPSSTGSLGLHQISADIGSPVCSLPKSWDINKPNLFPQITLLRLTSHFLIFYFTIFLPKITQTHSSEITQPNSKQSYDSPWSYVYFIFQIPNRKKILKCEDVIIEKSL